MDPAGSPWSSHPTARSGAPIPLTIDAAYTNQIPDKAVYMDPAILKLVLSNVILVNAVKHSDAGDISNSARKKKDAIRRVENTSQEMRDTKEMPMTAGRQKREGGLGIFVVQQHLLDHEELAYQFDKRLWLTLRMELP